MEVNRCFGCMEESHGYPCPRCGYDPAKQEPQDFALQLPGSDTCCDSNKESGQKTKHMRRFHI